MLAKKKGKSVIIGDPRPKNRIKNAKAEGHKVAKDESSSSQKTKKPKLTFEMLMAKYNKGLAGQRFDNQTSDSKRPRSSRRKRFGQTPKQSEPSTIPTPYKPPVVMPWYPYPMSPFGYPFMYYGCINHLCRIIKSGRNHLGQYQLIHLTLVKTVSHKRIGSVDQR